MPPPADELFEDASLFLDLDGTLLDIVDRPEDVFADRDVCDLLALAAVRLNGRVAIVSGRSVEQIDAILGEVATRLAISGSHGCEHRWRGVLARPNRPESLDRAADRLRDFVRSREGVLLEEKSYGVAIHYRLAPTAEAASHSIAAALANELDLEIQHGKMVVELRVTGGDKGRAVHRMMARAPMAGTTPIFIGDDVTDEAGFSTARELGGHGILVGLARKSAADYRLASPTQLRAWLADGLR
jgi:trehalose 6-phosphate phosphatase